MLAASVSLELPTVLAWVAGVAGAVITALLGIIAWFLRRQIIKSDKTEASVQRLLEGNVEWIRSLSERVNETDDKNRPGPQGVDVGKQEHRSATRSRGVSFMERRESR